MKIYLIDLDGTMYSGNKNIDGAKEFITYLQKTGKRYIFLTNNSTRTKKQAKEHMLNLGFKDIKEKDFFTSAMAAAKYISKNLKEKKSCFVIGEDGLIEALRDKKIEILDNDSENKKADFVFIGLDRKANYHKYSMALHHILSGAKIIATNTDRLISNNNKFDLGNGSIVSMFEYATNKKSLKIGKPSLIMLNMLLEEFSLNKENLILVGDNLETDIKLGYDSKIKTIMVCTGIHSQNDIEKLKIYPDKVVQNLKELIE